MLGGHILSFVNFIDLDLDRVEWYLIAEELFWLFLFDDLILPDR